MATRYYTLNTATTPAMLSPLALPVAVDGRLILHPTPAQAAQLGAFPRAADDVPPTPPEGKMAEPDGWETREGAWRGKWRIVDVPPPTLAEYDSAMEEHLFKERSERGYTTREPTAYLASGNARWAADARDWVAHVDAVMAYALELVNAVESGRRPAPTMAEFRAGLPAIAWSFVEGAL